MTESSPISRPDRGRTTSSWLRALVTQHHIKGEVGAGGTHARFTEPTKTPPTNPRTRSRGALKRREAPPPSSPCRRRRLHHRLLCTLDPSALGPPCCRLNDTAVTTMATSPTKPEGTATLSPSLSRFHSLSIKEHPLDVHLEVQVVLTAMCILMWT
jgi:hypothetical protein